MCMYIVRTCTCTSLDVGSLFPYHVRVLCERDVNLERDSLRLGVKVGQDQFPSLLHIGWQTHHLDLGVWEWGNG